LLRSKTDLERLGERKDLVPEREDTPGNARKVRERVLREAGIIPESDWPKRNVDHVP
jgi:hypothetical protein